MIYRILAENVERLEKKLTRIGNKCKKYGNEFSYAVVGEEYADVEDNAGNTRTLKFFLVDADGKAIVNDWKFIAAIEHTEEGNIFHNATEIEIPQKYYACPPKCEHCNNKRARKDTYIVQNTVTGEFKQVGKSCLTDFTRGMSAEGVAAYISLFDELIQGEAPILGGHYANYIRVEDALCCIAETIRHFGFVKADGDRPTKVRAREYYDLNYGYNRFTTKEKVRLREEMKAVSFNAESEEAKKLMTDALNWLKALDREKDGNYLHNLRTACSLEYVDYSHFGLLSSLFPVYDKALIIEQKKQEQKENDASSVHIGEVGERIKVEIKDFRCITSWYTQFGLTAVFLFHDTNGNVFTWKTGNIFPEDATKIVGTVKEHKEYNGVKQTELTRCKIFREQKRDNVGTQEMEERDDEH